MNSSDRPNSQLVQDLFEKLINGERAALSRAVTLVESTLEHDIALAKELIDLCLPHTGGSWRIGVTGVPGVGKSTFIDAFGSILIERGKKVAVLAVDPSSQRSGGSILGDKTRMSRLSVSDHAFVRPSPASDTLGGVTRKTRESILLCEAAGYNVVLVETVGVGQSETAVRSMTDFFLLLMLAGAGDELQGIKRGIMEMADFVAINKAEGDNLARFREAVSDYRNALHLMPANENGRVSKVEMISSIEGTGLDSVYAELESFFTAGNEKGFIAESRRKQALTWFHMSMEERVKSEFMKGEGVALKLKSLEQAVLNGEMDAFAATDALFKD